jgi:uncharacterized protein YeaO (DUF488 family)
MICIKRIYDRPQKSDGVRILIDRLWPRGVTREKARIDLWMKDIAPSDTLRKWYHHDQAKWNQFKKKYDKELSAHQKELVEIVEKSRDNHVTLLFSAKNQMRNNAVALIEILQTYHDSGT